MQGSPPQSRHRQARSQWGTGIMIVRSLSMPETSIQSALRQLWFRAEASTPAICMSSVEAPERTSPPRTRRRPLPAAKAKQSSSDAKHGMERIPIMTSAGRIRFLFKLEHNRACCAVLVDAIRSVLTITAELELVSGSESHSSCRDFLSDFLSLTSQPLALPC